MEKLLVLKSDSRHTFVQARLDKIRKDSANLFWLRSDTNESWLGLLNTEVWRLCISWEFFPNVRLISPQKKKKKCVWTRDVLCVFVPFCVSGVCTQQHNSRRHDVNLSGVSNYMTSTPIYHCWSSIDSVFCTRRRRSAAALLICIKLLSTSNWCLRSWKMNRWHFGVKMQLGVIPQVTSVEIHNCTHIIGSVWGHWHLPLLCSKKH